MNHSQNIFLGWAFMSVVLVFGVPGMIGVVRDRLRERRRWRKKRRRRASNKA